MQSNAIKFDGDQCAWTNFAIDKRQQIWTEIRIETFFQPEEANRNEYDCLLYIAPYVQLVPRNSDLFAIRKRNSKLCGGLGKRDLKLDGGNFIQLYTHVYMQKKRENLRGHSGPNKNSYSTSCLAIL